MLEKYSSPQEILKVRIDVLTRLLASSSKGKYSYDEYEYYTTKRSKGKSHNNVLGHVSNQLVRVIFKLLTENISFNLS